MIARQIIGKGVHGKVEFDPNTHLVSKRYWVSDPSEAESLAAKEAEYLQRFSEVLKPLPFLSCPTPVKQSIDRGGVSMTYCIGDRLDELLTDSNSEVDEHLDHLATQISLAVDQYVTEFGEPCYDFTTWNMIYDKQSAVLSIIDFTPAQRPTSNTLARNPREATIGTFLGMSTVYSVRPQVLFNRHYWRRQRYLNHLVVKRQEREASLSSRETIFAAVDPFVATRKGGFLRWLWYSTIGGMLLGRRLREVFSHAFADSFKVDETLDHRALANAYRSGPLRE